MEKKKIEKTVLQKLSAFRTNLFESGGKNQGKLLEEQKCITYFEDDVCEIGQCLYYKSVIHFADVESGNEIKASSISNVGIIQARANALKALCARSPVSQKSESDEPAVDDNVKSPTPARMPSEPSGGVPKNFKGFPK